MIDEKKIEESARDYINKNGYFVKYDEDPCVDIEIAYKEGAKWAINEFLKNLWHDASEKPDKNRLCLVRIVYHLNHGMFQDEERIEQSSFHDFGWYDCNFKYIGVDHDIVSYLYIDDLLPKKETKMTRKEINLRGIFRKPFGTMYRTRCGRKAVLVNTSDVIEYHSELYVQEGGMEDFGCHLYAPNGKCLDGDSSLDIIGLLN